MKTFAALIRRYVLAIRIHLNNIIIIILIGIFNTCLNGHCITHIKYISYTFNTVFPNNIYRIIS